MPLAGFELAIQESARPQTYALTRQPPGSVTPVFRNATAIEEPFKQPLQVRRKINLRKCLQARE